MILRPKPIINFELQFCTLNKTFVRLHTLDLIILEEIADLALFLASENTEYITGAAIDIIGGDLILQVIQNSALSPNTPNLAIIERFSGFN